MTYVRIVALAAFAGTLAAPTTARAQLGNLTYTQQELFRDVSLFNASNMPGGPAGSNTVVMVHGLLVVMGSNDSGKPPGPFHVFDVKDPRHPVRLVTFSSALTAQNRELHAMPLALIDGKFILACPQTSGVAFYDFTDPMSPKDVGSLALTGVNGGDYDNVAWELSWSWPYLYVGASGSGVHVIDATDPSRATSIKNIPIGQLGNFRVGPVHAAGNYLTVVSMDQNPTGVSILDVSDPKAPFLLTTTSIKSVYSALTIGDLIFGVGEGARYSFLKWTPDAITNVAEKTFGTDKGGYCTYQDGFGFCGQSKDGFFKLDLRSYDAAGIKQVGNGKPSGAEASGGDFDFATVMGNLVYLGNDHGSGASLIPHDTKPDTTPPKLFKAYPVDRAVKQSLSTRVTLFFTDEIDLDTVTSANLVLRKAGGAPIAGVFSRSSFNAISFGPRQPLSASTTYEIVVKAGGVKDLAGNAIADDAISRFSTGATIDLGPDGGSTTDGGPRLDAGGATGAGGASPMGAGGAGVAGGSAGAGGMETGGSAGTGTGGSTGAGTDGSVASSGSSGSTSSVSTTVAGTGGGDTAATGGSSSTGDVKPGRPTVTDAPDGCGCSVLGRPAAGSALSLLVAALFVLRRRQRPGAETKA